MTTKKVRKVYEVGFHLVPTVGEQSEKKIEEMKSAIVAGGGEVVGAVTPERIDLAYTIRHSVRRQDGTYNRYDEAYFGSVKFKASQGFVESFRKDLQANNDILRFLIIESVEGETRIGTVLPGVIDDEKKEEHSRRPTGRGVRKGAVSNEGKSEEKGERGADQKEKDSAGGSSLETKEATNATIEK